MTLVARKQVRSQADMNSFLGKDLEFDKEERNSIRDESGLKKTGHAESIGPT